MLIAIIALLGICVLLLLSVCGLLQRILDNVKFLRDYVVIKQHIEETIGKAVKPPHIGLN